MVKVIATLIAAELNVEGNLIVKIKSILKIESHDKVQRILE